jgi:hypothetical protein
MYHKLSSQKFKEIRVSSLFLMITILFLIPCSCDRPGGEDEEGRSYTYGLQITSVADYEDKTSYIIFDMSTENVGTDERAEITIENVVPSDSSSSSTSSDNDSTLFAYDETDSIHLTAYRVDYHIDGFGGISPYVGRINIVIPAGGSQSFNILLITGPAKESILDSLGYESKKGYLTITFSGYDGDGNDKSRAIDVDAFVYTYERATQTPSVTATATVTTTPTNTVTSTKTATVTATP